MRRGRLGSHRGADPLAQLRGVDDRLAVDLQSPGRRPAARPAPPRRRPHARPAPARCSGAPRPMRCIACASTSLPSMLSSGSATWRMPRPCRVADAQRSAPLVERGLRQLPAQVGHRARPRSSSSPSADASRTQSPARRPARSARLAGRRRADHRLRLVDADPVGGGVEQHREQQVGDRPGGDDRRALPQRLAVEGPVRSCGGDRRLRARRACARSRRAAAPRRRTRCPAAVGATRWRRQTTRPKPTEKRSTLTPQASATR